MVSPGAGLEFWPGFGCDRIPDCQPRPSHPTFFCFGKLELTPAQVVEAQAGAVLYRNH